VSSRVRTRPQTLAGVIAQCVPGKKVADVCVFGDSVIVGMCGQSFKSKKVVKGVAFPTCLSVNEVVCHYSPLAAESIVLAAGDLVKM
jgi:methionine aminopeptidase